MPSGKFATAVHLIDHFNRHGADIGASTPADYEQQADAFLNGPIGSGTLEKTRPNGDVIRYDPATEAFGIVKNDGTIRTFFRPDPAVHGFPTNLDYYHAQ